MTDLQTAYHEKCDEVIKLKDDLERVSAERDLAREAATDGRVRLEEERTLRLRMTEERDRLRGLTISLAEHRAHAPVKAPCLACTSGWISGLPCPVCQP